MILSRCAGNKFEFGGVLYTKSCFHSMLWTNFPKKNIAETIIDYTHSVELSQNIIIVNVMLLICRTSLKILSFKKEIEKTAQNFL